jgi:ribonuclease HII
MRFGVDEAGKGPVLGSMFAAAVVAAPSRLPDDVGDSKDVAPARRAALADEIRDRALAVAVAEVPVSRIDDPETDMTSLTVAAHADALGAVARDGLSGLVDAGDVDAARFGRRVAAGVDAAVEVTAEHGADASDAVVGAASIVAKEAREAHVGALAERHGDVGSGYPSDPATRAFLRDFVAAEGRLPDCARASWATSRDVLAASEQSSIGEF